MAEVEKYGFSYQEIVTQMIKAQGIHEGNWALFFEFGIQGANIATQLVTGGASIAPPNGLPTEVTPSAVISIQKIGIAKTDHKSNISVDAAVVNPKRKAK